VRTGSGSVRWRLKLTVRLAGSATAAAAAAGPVTAALEAAAAAGIQSLEPGRNNGAVLTASFEHILQQARCGSMDMFRQHGHVQAACPKP
jgi:hypothetical protein